MKLFELCKKQPLNTRIKQVLKETNLRLKEGNPSVDDLRAKMQTLKKLLMQVNSKNDPVTARQIQKTMARLNAKAKEMGANMSGPVSKDPNNLGPAPEYNLYSEGMALCNKVLEDAGTIDWEPQPEFRGQKGITTSTGFAEKEAAQAGFKKAWKLLNQMLAQATRAKKLDQVQSIKAKMSQLQQSAQAKGLNLNGDSSNLGLGERRIRK